MKPSRYIVHVQEDTPDHQRIYCASRAAARKCAAMVRSKLLTVRIEAVGF